jgi:hypothetical protein
MICSHQALWRILRWISFAPVLLLVSCASYPAGDQQVIYIPTENGARAERVSVGANAEIRQDIDPAEVREMLARFSSLGWRCYNFAYKINPTFSNRYVPQPGDLVYREGGANDWFVTHESDLELKCLLQAPGNFTFAKKGSESAEYERRLYALMMSKPGSPAQMAAGLRLRELALKADAYSRTQPYLANLAIEITASQKLFEGLQSFDTCGQANCRFLHRTCGQVAPTRWSDQTNFRAYRLLCELRNSAAMLELRSRRQ